MKVVRDERPCNAAADDESPGAAQPGRRLTPEQGVSLWVDVMNACEQFLLAGLRRQVGPNGDVIAAYRQWYSRQMEEHDRMMLHMMEQFDRRSRGHAG